MSVRIQAFNAASGIAVTLFVVDCARCGVVYAVTKEYEQRRREDGKGWHCPNGHSQVFIRRAEDDLRDQLSREQVARQEAERALGDERVEHEKTESARRKLVAQVRNGVCPWCTRHFDNLQAHVASKHPDTEEDAALQQQPVVHKRRARWGQSVSTACYHTVPVTRTAWYWRDVTCPKCLRFG